MGSKNCQNLFHTFANLRRRYIFLQLSDPFFPQIYSILRSHKKLQIFVSHGANTFDQRNRNNLNYKLFLSYFYLLLFLSLSASLYFSTFPSLSLSSFLTLALCNLDRLEYLKKNSLLIILTLFDQNIQNYYFLITVLAFKLYFGWKKYN
jgi:hypothetical protein